MKRSIKIAITACLAGIMAIALAFGIILANDKTPVVTAENAFTLKGEYNHTLSLFSAGDSKAVDVAQDVTYTTYETKGKVSTDNQYLLVVVAIDDVAQYSSMGLSIKADGEELVTTFDGETYYTSIKYKNGTVETSADFYGEDNEDKGMLVFEVPYDADKAYRVTPSFTTKTDSTTLYGQMKTTKDYALTANTACEGEGYKTYTYGNDSYQVPANATGHTEETIIGTPATETQTGLTDGKKCSFCGKVTVEQQVIPALGKTVTYNATDTQEQGTAVGKSGTSYQLKNSNDMDNAWIALAFEVSADMNITFSISNTFMSPDVNTTNDNHAILSVFNVYIMPVGGSYEQITAGGSGTWYSDVVNEEYTQAIANWNGETRQLCTLNLTKGAYKIKIAAQDKWSFHTSFIQKFIFGGVTGDMSLYVEPVTVEFNAGASQNRGTNVGTGSSTVQMHRDGYGGIGSIDNSWLELSFVVSADMSIDLSLNTVIMYSKAGVNYTLLDLYNVWIKPVDGTYEQITANGKGTMYSDVSSDSFAGTGDGSAVSWNTITLDLCKLNLTAGTYTLKVQRKSTAQSYATTFNKFIFTFGGETTDLTLATLSA